MSVKINDNVALTRIFTGQKMYVDVRDISLAPHLLLEGYWEWNITQVFQRTLKPEDVFFDIGANFGYFTLIAGTIVKPNKIFAFEANPELTALVNKSLWINGLQSAKLENLAVGDVKGTATLQVPGDFFGSGALSTGDNEYFKTLGVDIKTFTVPLVSLDEYCEQNKISNVSYIKMDVEGHEQKVYAGMKKIIAENPSLRMLVEYTDNSYSDSEKFFELLKKDFSYVYSIDSNGTLVPLDTYQELKKRANGDFIMLFLSHQSA